MEQEDVERALLSEPDAVQHIGIAPALTFDHSFEDSFLRLLFPEFEDWRAILAYLDIPVDVAVQLAIRAKSNSTRFDLELLVSGLVSDAQLYEAIAMDIGIAYVGDFDAERLIIGVRQYLPYLCGQNRYPSAKLEQRDGRIAYLIAPEGLPIGTLRRHVARKQKLRPYLRLTTPRSLRQAIMRKARAGLANEARNALFDRMPDHSAKIVADAWQGLVLGILIVLFALALTLKPTGTFVGVHIFSSVFFFACIGLRFAAAHASIALPPTNLEQTPRETLPRYSVLVALHREVDVVAQLVAALDALVWPRSKLEIKLVCEADDAETLDAIATLVLPPHFEVIQVPPGKPRTKPKALNFALPLISGDFVVLFDAEDRPHPLQMLEAWRRFEIAGPELACLQAPLEITNGDSGMLPRLFAFEYAALFRGLLPWLSGRLALLPLGGTSNHIRVAALREVGGWDPYNVTEDADLGTRLARFGYRTETISLPTLEDAPETLSSWIPQRTRWFKGWLQTYLVHMRDPVALFTQLGLRSFVLVQILFAGLILSALIHPLLIVAALYLAVEFAWGEPILGWRVILLTLDVVNVVCGYLSFLLLGWYALRKTERKAFWQTIAWTPVYWMLLSLAAWRSVFQLWRNPHKWEKTTHFRTRAAVSGSPIVVG